MNHRPTPLLAGLVALLWSCSGSGEEGPGSAPIAAPPGPPEIVLGRARLGNAHNWSELRGMARNGLGEDELSDRTGIEFDVAIDPRGEQAVFVREREIDDPRSRELVVFNLQARAENRLTGDRFIDDDPCWSPDSTTLLFSSDRGGMGRRLWLLDADGSNLRPLADDGLEQAEPAWCPVTERIAYRGSDGGRARIFTIPPGGGPAFPITSGGALDELGDFSPSFSPDGTSVLFVRRSADGTGRVLRAPVIGGGPSSLVVQRGDFLDRPRWTPSGERVLVLRSPGPDSPTQLWSFDRQGRDGLLLQLDQRFTVLGFDIQPTSEQVLAEAVSRPVSLDNAVLELPLGLRGSGDLDSLRAADGNALIMATVPFDERERAGINLRLPLGLADPTELFALKIRIRSAISRPDPDAVLRVTLYSPLTDRFETVLERSPENASLFEVELATRSLAHVSSDGAIAIGVIADLPNAGVAELAIDQIEVEYRRRLR